EVDDGVAEVEGVHAEDAGDFGAGLLQRELRQWSYAKFFRRHFEGADVEVVNFRRTDPLRHAPAKLRGDPRRFRPESERFDEGLVQGRDKRAGINEQTRLLATD